MMKGLRGFLKSIVPGPVHRYWYLSHHGRRLRARYFARRSEVMPTVFATGELHNFTYDLTDRNLRDLAEMIAVATKRPAAEIEGYIREAVDDIPLRRHFDGLMHKHTGAITAAHVKSPFGRRLGWYAVARAMKPRVIVETGVERGHGALILNAALIRNAAEGNPGRYFGTDINPEAGWLLQGPYAASGHILYGDSITSLRGLNETVDLFINDSDHSAEYEALEYEEIAPKLSPEAIILGDNAHVTDKLARFSRAQGRHFINFREEPKDHWYPGAAIGISFR